MNNGGVTIPPSIGGTLYQHARRLFNLEQSDGSGVWTYVCVDNTDPNYTPMSPLFENGWDNAGAPDAPVAFKRFYNWIHIRGGFTNASITSGVVFRFQTSADGTTPASGELLSAYIPLFRQQLLVPLGDGSGSASVLVDVDGTVTYINQGPF